MIKIIGIKNCDTCRKALKWLDAEGVSHQWQDFRETPLSKQEISDLLGQTSLDLMLNKRSTSYRSLPDAVKEKTDPESWVDVFLEAPTLIKRPIFVTETETFFGFKKQEQEKLKSV